MTEEAPATTPTAVRMKLFLMMVLEFFIWGAWLPMIFGYLPALGFTGLQGTLILCAFPVAAIVGMFFSNQFADRSFAAERFLSFSHLVGGLAMLGLGFTKDFNLFFALMAVHCLLYVPTMSVTNSIAFTHIKNPQSEFGLIRMGGTIGWILAAWPFAFILVDWAKVPALQDVGFVDKRLWHLIAAIDLPESGAEAESLLRDISTSQPIDILDLYTAVSANQLMGRPEQAREIALEYLKRRSSHCK